MKKVAQGPTNRQGNPQKLVAILRAKNDEKYVVPCLTKLSSLVDEIIVLDNGSKDNTIAELKKFPKVIKVICHDDTNNYHEGRDMLLLLNEAKARNPDWITFACLDEVFEKNLTRKIIEKYMNSSYDRISFRMCNFWLSTKYCRWDRDWLFYALKPQRFMWRNLKGTYFNNVLIHHGSIQGITTPIYVSPYRIKHYGYAEKTDVDFKVRTYRKIDPDSDKYDSSDTKIKNVMLYPFIEFNNRALNYLNIQFYDLACRALAVIVRFKRKYIHKKLFPGNSGAWS